MAEVLAFDLSHIGLIEITGEAKAFLQGQLTCDLNAITPTHSLLGAHCNLKGRVGSLFRVMQWAPDRYMLSLPLRMVPSSLHDLKKYALFSKVRITDSSFTFYKTGVVGNWASIHTLPHLVHATPITENRYEVFTSEPLCTEKPPLSSDAWQCLDIVQKLPTVYPETRDCFLPHHLGLFELGGIGLEKGCYLGQEIIARMHYKGKIKKALIETSTEGELLTPGQVIDITDAYAQKTPATIIRSAQTSATTYTHLAMICTDL